MLDCLVPQWIFGLVLLFIKRSLTPFFCLPHSVLSPILNMPISDSKRQRVLVTACVLYSEVSSSLNHPIAVSNRHVGLGKVIIFPYFASDDILVFCSSIFLHFLIPSQIFIGMACYQQR